MPRPRTPDEPSPTGSASTSTGRVLVLDDDADVGRVIGEIVESVGMESRLATEAQAFFSHLEDWGPTHIMLDLMMPDMDGVEVMNALADRGCTAHIVIVSGVETRVLNAARRIAAKRGLDVEVLPKPIRRATLKTLLGRHEHEPAPRLESTGTYSALHAFTEADLLEACRSGQLSVAYQPKVRCRDEALVGFEALVRWEHPRIGLVPPSLFIPVAENSGLIRSITTQVLTQATEWITSNPAFAGLTLAINVSARSLGDAEFAGELTAACRAAALEPERLILELTETAALDDPGGALDLLTRLRVRGFQLSIDDFGTGYSSMMQLARLPFSEIKIDKAFVQSMPTSEESRSIVGSIVELGHSMGMEITAEGIEHRNVLADLTGIGCDHAQGYFIARPMAPNDTVQWASQSRPSR